MPTLLDLYGNIPTFIGVVCLRHGLKLSSPVRRSSGGSLYRLPRPDEPTVRVLLVQILDWEHGIRELLLVAPLNRALLVFTSA
jgi:hypothetical protein